MMGVRKNSKNQRDKKGSKANGSSEHGGEADGSQPDPATRIWQVVALIPKGQVASYGQIAKLAGMPSHARLVGRTMSNLPKGTKLPWHRVVNSQLKISNPNNPELQARRLRKEGVEFVGARIARGCRWDTD